MRSIPTSFACDTDWMRFRERLDPVSGVVLNIEA
jgi:acetone carboxylase gamma subunit